MGNVQVRLPDDLERELEEMATELHTNRSEAMRRALEEGLGAMRLDHAVQRYLDDEVSLTRAARTAGVSIPRMARELADRGVPTMRYGVPEADADADRARQAMRDASDG